MGKAAKQARNRAIKRQRYEDRCKAEIERARAILDLINKPTRGLTFNIDGCPVPNWLVKAACEKFLAKNFADSK